MSPELKATPMTGPADLKTSAPSTVPGDRVPFPGCPRRTLLKAAGLVALAGASGAAFAACAADETATPAAGSAAPPSSAGPATEAPSAAPSSASASADASSSAPAPSGPSVVKADVPKGGGVILQSADFVVTQPTAGDYKAFSSTCTHMGTKVGEINGDVIKCLKHGSEFSIQDGSVVNGPATSPLPEAKITESGDKLVISA